MADSRIQYQFQSISDSLANGWTENFYIPGQAAAGAFRIAADETLVRQRRLILSPDFRLSGIRCTTVGSRGDTVGVGFALASGRGLFPAPAAPATQGEQPWDALLLRMKSTTNHIRQFPLRGIPPGVFQDTINLNPQGGQFFQLLDIWMETFLTQRPAAFSMRIENPPSDPWPVDTVGYWQANRGLVLGVSGAFPTWIQARAVGRLKNVQGINPSTNHIWRVQQVVGLTAGASIYLFRGRRTYAGVGSGPMEFSHVQYTYDPIIIINPIRAMKRSTGRPPALLRGRALVRS